MCHCISAFLILFTSLESRAFTQFHLRHHHQHHPCAAGGWSASPGRCEQCGTSSQTRASLNRPDDDDDDIPITYESAVTGVTLKMAFDSSAVWGVADLSETNSKRFTSSESLDLVHRLRRESCAVLVGRGTVEQDDCTLTVRRVELGEGKYQPVRAVIDPSLRIIGGNYTLLNDGLPTIIYHLQTNTPVKSPNECVILVGLELSDDESERDGKSFISPTEVVNDLNNRGFQHIMVEGGPATACAFIKSGAVDRAILVKAPIEFNEPIPAMMNESTLALAGLQMIGTAELGGDRIEYWTRHGLDWPNQQLHMWP